jgi:hypothetical protein
MGGWLSGSCDGEESETCPAFGYWPEDVSDRPKAEPEGHLVWEDSGSGPGFQRLAPGPDDSGDEL